MALRQLGPHVFSKRHLSPIAAFVDRATGGGHFRGDTSRKIETSKTNAKQISINFYLNRRTQNALGVKGPQRSFWEYSEMQYEAQNRKRFTGGRMRLSAKLPLALAGIATAVGILCSAVVLWLGVDAVTLSDRDRLTTITKARAAELSSYLETINSDLHFQSGNPLISAALADFGAAWREMAGELGGAPGAHLRKLYIDDNPHPTGQKEELDWAPDGSAYSATHAKYHPWLRTFLRDRGYYDIFIVDASGDLVYTVYKELDYATNLISGKYNDSGLGIVAKAVLQDGAKIAFDDFSPYAASHGAPAAFIGSPILDSSGKRTGALIFQFPIDRINAVMQSANGLGETGETVIVGKDKLLRSASRLTTENTILQARLNLPVVDKALAGSSGIEAVAAERPGFEGASDTVIAFENVSFHGADFAILGMISEEELFAPIQSMIIWALLSVAAVMAVVVVVGLLLARSISVPIVRLRAVMATMAGGNHEVTVPEQGRGDEIGEMAEAVEVFRLNMAETERLQAEADAKQKEELDRAERLRDTTREFETDAQSMTELVASAATELETTAKMLNGIAEQSEDRATRVAAASEQTSANVQTVATASTELAASIGEISRQVSSANDLSQTVQDEAENTQREVEELAEAAQQIGDVVNLIQEIAEQTNLLALNATIESARAGEAGKGFAVVAQEVKNLAGQTAQATGDISQRIQTVQDRTKSAVSAIAGIVKRVNEVREVAANVAAAVEEQDSATKEISRNVEEVSTAADEVSTNISAVREAAGETGTSSGQVLTTAQDLARQSEALRSRVTAFLNDVRAA